MSFNLLLVVHVFFYAFATISIFVMTKARALKVMLNKCSHNNHSRIEQSHRLLFERKKRCWTFIPITLTLCLNIMNKVIFDTVIAQVEEGGAVNSLKR